MAALKYKNSNGEYVTLPNYVVQPIDTVQTTGTSETSVMSQNAVTSELNTVNTEIDKLYDLATMDAEDKYSYGIEWDTTVSSPLCTRIGNLDLHRTLPVQTRLRGCLLDDSGSVIEYLNPTDWTTNTRDGSRGQVMVEIPQHYRKFEINGTKRRCKISEYPLPEYHMVPKMYISAYEASIERSTGKLCSIVNMDADYRGGNNTADWDGTYRSLLGRPVTSINRTGFREAARKRNAGVTSEWNCLDYNAYKAIFWLYYVEYANRNCQSAFTAQRDGNGFMQGGLGNGVTTWDWASWSSFNSGYPFIPCGYTDGLGNYSGEIAYNILNASGGTLTTVMVPRYRGIENPFGHVWKWSDGINIQRTSESSKIYVSDDPSKYNDANYDGYTYRGLEARNEGWVKELVFGEYGEILPSVVGGSSTTYWSDYHWTNTNSGLYGCLFSAGAYDGAYAGLACAFSHYVPSIADSNVGSRLCFIPIQRI